VACRRTLSFSLFRVLAPRTPFHGPSPLAQKAASIAADGAPNRMNLLDRKPNIDWGVSLLLGGMMIAALGAGVVWWFFFP
jgi:hypothetical protein